MIYLIPILAFIILVADYRITARNMHVPWNGFGCIRQVIQGQALQPMQYRVLVPWLTTLLGGSVRAYLMVKYMGIVFMLYSFYYYISILQLNATLGVAILCAVIPITYMFDYADAYWELGFISLGFALILGGASIWLICGIIIVATLNRETAIILPVVIGLSALNASIIHVIYGFMAILSFLVGYVIPHIIYGKKERYCPFNQLKNNLAQMKRELPNLMSGYVHFILMIILLVCLVVVNGPVLLPILIANIVLMGLLIVPGKWNEVRIFLPLATILIPMGLK